MADEKHEDKKPETAKPTEVIGEHKTGPTTAPPTAHAAPVRPGAGPVHFDCVEPYACSCTSYRVYPGTIGGCNAPTAPTPGDAAEHGCTPSLDRGHGLSS